MDPNTQDHIRRYLCFPRTFDEGRAWFKAQAPVQGGRLESSTIPRQEGPGGESLSTEVSWFGEASAPRVFVNICGTHGQEYFCGAAAQLNWITSGGPGKLPDDVAVCLVHAHNPYGAAYLSRGNENFVDLNRNYFDHSISVRPNPLYAELFELLFTKEMDEHVLDDVMAEFYSFVERNDTQAALTAMGGGQNTHPSGTLYCGRQTEWSTSNLQSIVRTYLGQAEKIALIDWHTGLGEFGKATALLGMAPDAPERSWAYEWWGSEEEASEIEGPEKVDYIGQVCHGVAGQLRSKGTAVAETVFEMGTFGNQGVLAALLIDRWLRFECKDPNDPHAVVLRTRMIERLNPSLPEWRAAILERTAEVYAASINGLSNWAD